MTNEEMEAMLFKRIVDLERICLYQQVLITFCLPPAELEMIPAILSNALSEAMGDEVRLVLEEMLKNWKNREAK